LPSLNIAGAPDGDPLGGILGSILGESPAAQKARIEEATRSANDLSGLVRHKKKPAAAAATQPTPGDAQANGNGKRKLDESEVASHGNGLDSKKAKIEEAP
jgi:HAT1-interacting factor 1